MRCKSSLMVLAVSFRDGWPGPAINQGQAVVPAEPPHSLETGCMLLPLLDTPSLFVCPITTFFSSFYFCRGLLR